jgi:aryl-alcohol dehydrogenase-like predicted oxidoreductase
MNERLVGKALRRSRGQVKIAMKFGIRFDTSSGIIPYPLVMDSSPVRIRESVEGSLKRLAPTISTSTTSTASTRRPSLMLSPA